MVLLSGQPPAEAEELNLISQADKRTGSFVIFNHLASLCTCACFYSQYCGFGRGLSEQCVSLYVLLLAEKGHGAVLRREGFHGLGTATAFEFLGQRVCFFLI